MRLPNNNINRRICTMPTKFCELNVRHHWKLSWPTASPRFLLYPAGAAISTLNRQQKTGNFSMPVLEGDFNLSQVHPVTNELIFPTSRPEEWQIKPVEWSGGDPYQIFSMLPDEIDEMLRPNRERERQRQRQDRDTERDIHPPFPPACFISCLMSKLHLLLLIAFI